MFKLHLPRHNQAHPRLHFLGAGFHVCGCYSCLKPQQNPPKLSKNVFGCFWVVVSGAKSWKRKKYIDGHGPTRGQHRPFRVFGAGVVQSFLGAWGLVPAFYLPLKTRKGDVPHVGKDDFVEHLRNMLRKAQEHA